MISLILLFGLLYHKNIGFATFFWIFLIKLKLKRMPFEPYAYKYSNWVLKKMSLCGIINLSAYLATGVLVTLCYLYYVRKFML